MSPCLFGIISRNASASPAGTQKPDDRARMIANLGSTAALYTNSERIPIKQIQAGDRTRILAGAIYGLPKGAIKQDDLESELAGVNIPELDGSFIVVDVEESAGSACITISTDKYGTRRLYYTITEQFIIFSTHILGFHLLGHQLNRNIQDDTLLHYYNFGFAPTDASLFPGVMKLPAGSQLVIQNGKATVRRYFDVKEIYRPDAFAEFNEAELCERIDTAFARGISRRAGVGEAVGISLSGGVDSGYIAQKLTQTGATVFGYNISYADYYDEEDRVDFLARSLQLDVRKIRLSADQIIENFEQVSAMSSEPTSLNGSIMRFAAAQAKEDGLVKLFDGDGADRLFLGMNRYLGYKRAIDLYNCTAKFGMTGPLRMILGMLPGSEFQKFNILVSNWHAGIPPYPERRLGGVETYDQKYEAAVYQLGAQPYFDRYRKDFGAFEFGSYFTYQSFHMCPEMFFHGSTEMMTDLGISPIPAFFTDEMVELAFNIPTNWKLRDRTTKYILRKAAAQHMDKEYWMLPKIGLQSALRYVLQTDEGKRWYANLREKVLDSSEYKALAKLARGQEIETDRLVSLIAWKDV